MKHTLLVAGLLAGAVATAQEKSAYLRPPEVIAQVVEAPPTPWVVVSPDKNWLVLLERSDYPGIEELSRPELRLAGLRINPDNFGPSRASDFTGIKLKSLKDGKEYAVAGLPSVLRLSNLSFSPDSKKLALLQTYPNRIEAWWVDLGRLQARTLASEHVNAAVGTPLVWLADSQTLLMQAALHAGRPAPVRARVPDGPVVEENLGKKAPARTYQDLLKNTHDEALLDFFASSQLLAVTLTGTTRPLGKPAIYTAVNPSPDGQHILTRTIQRPYSYLVTLGSFPQLVQVLDPQGNLVKKLWDIPLADNIPLGFDAVVNAPRNISWRADAPATLVWAEALDGGDPKKPAPYRDRVMAWNAPFAGQPQKIIELPFRYGGITWGNDQYAWLTEVWRADRKERVHQFAPATPGAAAVIFDRSSEDVYTDPGSPVMVNNAWGRPVMSIQKDQAIFLTGNGASPAGDLPFLDRFDLRSRKTTRLWRCEAPYYERVVSMLDGKRFITSRESQAENPNYFLRTVGSNTLQPLTDFANPYPQLKDVKKEVLKYQREDGVDLTADLYLPPGYKKEDGPLPTFLWAYPVEYKSKSNASQVRGSPHTFTRINWGSPIFWALRGYAVLNNATIPIVGEGNAQPNDTYIQQLVASAKAAIDHGVALGVTDRHRVGVGGHSYGAFMTANLLAHADLFKAGIARSGAYNRTLTPFGFQNEERSYWEAPEVYFNMSPFSFADKINEPVLLIHGEADNNPGTFPMQSERLYNAIKGHGGTTRLVLLPYESHGYAARESILHTLAEMDAWLERYVKKANNPSGTQILLKD